MSEIKTIMMEIREELKGIRQEAKEGLGELRKEVRDMREEARREMREIRERWVKITIKQREEETVAPKGVKSKEDKKIQEKEEKEKEEKMKKEKEGVRKETGARRKVIACGEAEEKGRKEGYPTGRAEGMTPLPGGGTRGEEKRYGKEEEWEEDKREAEKETSKEGKTDWRWEMKEREENKKCVRIVGRVGEKMYGKEEMRKILEETTGKEIEIKGIEARKGKKGDCIMKIRFESEGERRAVWRVKEGLWNGKKWKVEEELTWAERVKRYRVEERADEEEKKGKEVWRERDGIWIGQEYWEWNEREEKWEKKDKK